MRKTLRLASGVLKILAGWGIMMASTFGYEWFVVAGGSIFFLGMMDLLFESIEFGGEA